MITQDGHQRADDHARDRLRSFDLGHVQLLPGPVLDRQERNGAYLLSLDVDRLLHVFRLNAGIATQAEPLGGWESPDCGLRGHFVGHYLTACAQLFAVTQDTRYRDRAAATVTGLGECQDRFGTGFLAAFPVSDLDTIETKFDGAWAPYYVLQKILAGLISVAQHCGNADALRRAVWLADYIGARIAKIPAVRLDRMLRTDLKPNPTNEFGALSETLQDLHVITRKHEHLELAKTFDRDWFVDPLKRRDDHLTGLHANTHLAMALGLARRYEHTREAWLRDAVEFFWERTALARSYVNGGSSGPRPDGTEKSVGGEHWPAPFRLAGTLTPKINESCVAHGMFKLTDALLRWTGEPRYADFLERLFFNAVLPVIHPCEAGRYLYDHPLSAGSKRKYGGPLDSFWCCYGSSVEAFARLGASIYYHGRDDAGTESLFVNLFVASQLNWPEKGLVVRQVTDFPTQDEIELRFELTDPVDLAVTLRVPGWASQGMTIEGPDDTLHVQAAAGTVTVARRWSDRDRLRVRLPQPFRLEAMPDDPAMVALLRGNVVLAAHTERMLTLPASDVAQLQDFLRVDRSLITLRLRDNAPVELSPLSTFADGPFGVFVSLPTAVRSN